MMSFSWSSSPSCSIGMVSLYWFACVRVDLFVPCVGDVVRRWAPARSRSKSPMDTGMRGSRAGEMRRY